MARLRLGIMGGTFDPPHLGHLILAETARQQLHLDRVRFIPAGDPWRKAGTHVSPVVHRLEMTRLAIADNEHFELDDCEVRREGPSYTSVTLQEIAAALPEAELFFLGGEDSLADLPRWKDPELIWEAASFVVAQREGYDAPTGIVPTERLVRLQIPFLGISSTSVRRMAEQGLSLRYLLPPAVDAYIREQGLYRG